MSFYKKITKSDLNRKKLIVHLRTLKKEYNLSTNEK